MSVQRGAALIIALWALALLTVIMTQVVQTLRLEGRQSSYALHHARAQLGAEAGLALVIQELRASPSTWVADGRSYERSFDDIQLTIKVLSERGKLDLNFVNVDQVVNLSRYLGATQAQAQRLGQAIRARRASGLPFKALEELQTQGGVTPELYALLAPYVTLWTGLSEPDPAFAPEAIRAVLKLAATPPNRNPGSVLTAQINANSAAGFSASLDVTFIIDPEGGSALLYRVLRWKE